jgi:hypothetical protein
MSLATRLSRLERQQPSCCSDAVTLLRLADGDPPSDPEVCPKCGRPQGRVVITEVIVRRVNGALMFVAPEWATFIPPAEVPGLLQLPSDSPDWDEAERKARRRQAAGADPYYHRPAERTP